MPEIIPDLSYLSYAIIIGSFGLIQAIAVAIIAGLFSRDSKKRKAENVRIEKLAHVRAEEARLAMRLMSASARLSSATAMAVKEGHVNGKMDIAMAEVDRALADYYDFINRVASTQIAADQ